MPVFANVTNGPASPIKSIQRGTISVASGGTTPATATITAVNTAKSIVNFLGFSGGQTVTSGSSNSARWFPRLSLTNSTTVTVDMAAGPDINSHVMSFEVVEYN